VHKSDPDLLRKLVLHRNRTDLEGGVGPSVHSLIVRMPKLEEPWNVIVWHPRPEVLHNIPLHYWNDLDPILSSKKVAIELESDLANCFLRFC
jgi:hypothetical protein